MTDILRSRNETTFLPLIKHFFIKMSQDTKMCPGFLPLIKFFFFHFYPPFTVKNLYQVQKRQAEDSQPVNSQE